MYGQTKLDGEKAIVASGCKYLIFRTSWVYAARGGNFAKTMLRLAQERERLTIINDQHGAPTGADLITDVNKRYLELGQLNVEIMGRGYAWIDTGTHDSLLDAASFIGTLQKRQGLMVACPEEIAYGQKWIDAAALQSLAAPLTKNGYGQYLLGLLK